MKTIYLIVLVFVVISGGLWIIMGNAANTILCITYWAISLPTQEVFTFPNFETCGR